MSWFTNLFTRSKSRERDNIVHLPGMEEIPPPHVVDSSRIDRVRDYWSDPMYSLSSEFAQRIEHVINGRPVIEHPREREEFTRRNRENREREEYFLRRSHGRLRESRMDHDFIHMKNI